MSYLTALDIYLWSIRLKNFKLLFIILPLILYELIFYTNLILSETCYFFVFSAVLEFCVLNFLMARKGRVRDKLVESRIKNSTSRQKNGMVRQ